MPEKDKSERRIPPLDPRNITDLEFSGVDPVSGTEKFGEQLAITDRRVNRSPEAARVVSDEDLESSARFHDAMQRYLGLVAFDKVQVDEAFAAVTEGWNEDARDEFAEDLAAQGIYGKFMTGPLKINPFESTRSGLRPSSQREVPREEPPIIELQPEPQPEVEGQQQQTERLDLREHLAAAREAIELYEEFLRDVGRGESVQTVYDRVVLKVTSLESNDALNRLVTRYMEQGGSEGSENDRSTENEPRQEMFSRLAEELGSRDLAFEQASEGLSSRKRDQFKRKLRQSGRWNTAAQHDPQAQAETPQPEDPPAQQPAPEAPQPEPQPAPEPVLDNAAPFDREALMHGTPAGNVAQTPYWIGPRGEAYVFFDDQPIEVNDRGSWKFRRSGEKYWDAEARAFVDERPPERPQQAQPEAPQPQPQPEPAEEPPVQQPQPEQQAPFDRDALLREQPAGSLGATSYWIGPRGEAYVSSPDHDKPIEVNDRGRWNFSEEIGEKYWDAEMHAFVDARPPERVRPADAPAPAAAVDAAPAAPAALERLRRPDREPDGEIDDRDYWVDEDGSAIIEDERDPRKFYRVRQGGIHWVAQKGDLENRKENRRDRTGFVWDGYGWQQQKRSEWGSEGVPHVEESPPLQPAIEPVAAVPRREAVREHDYRVARAETMVNRIPTDVAAAIVETKIGSLPSGVAIEGEKERIASAMKRLASADPAAFDRAQRALTAFSSFAKGEYKRAESAIDQQARFDDIPHNEYIEILRESDPERRRGMFRSRVESNFELLGSFWNRMTFGWYARRKTDRIERTSELLRERMENAETEVGKRRGLLRTILGIV
jgi:hypothetical protein